MGEDEEGVGSIQLKEEHRIEVVEVSRKSVELESEKKLILPSHLP